MGRDTIGKAFTGDGVVGPEELAAAEAKTGWISDRAIDREIAAARASNAEPLDLGLVLWKESGWRPGAFNAAGPAYGVAQITPAAAGAVGMSAAELPTILQMSLEEQMDRCVARFLAAMTRSFRGGRPYTEPVHVYQAWFAPATMRQGDDLSIVLYSAPSPAYRANAQIDNYKTGRPPKGTITLEDLNRWVLSGWDSSTFAAIATRIVARGGGSSDARAGSRGMVTVGALFFAVGLTSAAAAAYYAFWR